MLMGEYPDWYNIKFPDSSIDQEDFRFQFPSDLTHATCADHFQTFSYEINLTSDVQNNTALQQIEVAHNYQ